MRYLLLLLFLLLAGGCSNVPERPPVPDQDASWQQHYQRLLKQDQWSLHGRLAVKANDNGWNLTIHWEQRPNAFDISLIAPFGRGSLHLSGSPYIARLTTSDGDAFIADDPEALLQEQLGWHIPVSALRYWVRGIPSPQLNITATELDQWGRLQRLQQAGWTIRFLDYQSQAGLDLPRRVFASHPDADVRLVVSDWSERERDGS